MMNDEQRQMAIDNQRLVAAVIKQLNLVSNYWDFYDIGMIGLMKGCKSFNKNLGYKPSVYLWMCIKNEILMELRSRKKDCRKSNYNTISLDKEIKTGENTLTLQDVIASKFNVEEEMLKKDKLNLILESIKYLSDRERFIINHTYELNGCKKLNQERIAEVIGVTQSYVSRIKRNAIRKLKRNLLLEEQMV